MNRESIFALMSSFYQLFPGAKSIAVADPNKFIYYQPSSQIDLKIRPNEPVEEEKVTHKAIQTREKVAEQINQTNEHSPYYGIAVPILDNNELQGAVAAFYPRAPQSLQVPFLTVKADDRWLPIQLEQVIYMEAQNRKTYILSATGKGTHRNNLTELEMILPQEMFIRCHRSYIINMNQIKEIHPDSHSTFILVMKNDSRVPVSQSYAKYFRKQFGF
ncbi:LytTR family DNA-binding domain-containing protein [Virgibacillus sp. W0181]|uniref:LytTR family DNA-binding domain-containing protein n=1 Tax=Virgibacillus sp. W0181 TaxID=3391581 RepID=UPI003F45688B